MRSIEARNPRRRPLRNHRLAAALARGVTFLLLAVVAALPLAAQGSPEGEPPDHVPGELIVLLYHGAGAPTADEVMATHRRGETLPAGLGVGSPKGVRFGIRNRVTRGALEVAAADPDHPVARGQRYLVLEYPAVVDLDVLARALERNPHVLHVEKNLVFQLSATPNDPFFPVAGSPTSYQWGSHYMDLPAAWDAAKGHANVGLIDLGVDIDHPDLQAFNSAGTYVHGNFRPHLSFDFAANDTCVDERNACPGFTATSQNVGHGTHVSGIVAATTDNGTGVAGTCWHCSLLMARVLPSVALDDAANSLNWLVNHGAQVVSMSWGHVGSVCQGASGDLGLFCNELDLAERRDVVLTASPGNDKVDIEFPASDARVLSVGGIEPDGAFWDRADEGGCPCQLGTITIGCSTVPTRECGSNFTLTPGSAQQDLVAPAKHVVSTFYLGAEYAPVFDCSDAVGGPSDGYGPCTGTSMSSPYVAGIAGILRSLNPLLSKAEIRDLLVSNANRAGNWDPQLGFGVPDAAASVDAALGRAGGAVLANRLTPLFQLYGDVAEDHVYTTFPQVATGLKPGIQNDYRPKGPDVPGYHYFPDGNCLFFPCPAAASVYVFGGDRSPNGHPLVPLYRLSFEGTFPGGPSNPDNRDHTYTTEPAGIELFVGLGYQLDGQEGYIYERCSPEPSCIPAGAVRLYRYYNAARDDWALFPQSELAQWQADGYGPQSGANPWIGYVYENVDSDGDWVIDGFEGLIGTNPSLADTDGDGLTDGQEILVYPYADPLVGASQVIGELGTTSLSHVAKTVLFSRSYANPVVLAQPPGFNGAHTSVIRIVSVQADRFTMQIAEAPDQDGPHTTEPVSWIVLEAGSWSLPDGTPLEVGQVVTSNTVGRNVAGAFSVVSYPNPFPAAPVVSSQVQTTNDPSWAKTRQHAVGTTSFSVALEEEEASTTFHGTETIGWVAMGQAVGSWSGHRYQAGSSGNLVTDAFTAVSFDASAGFTAAPRFVASMATRIGADNAAIRYSGLTAAGVSIKLEEDTTFDAETGHVAETVHFLAIEGDGTLDAAPR